VRTAGGQRTQQLPALCACTLRLQQQLHQLLPPLVGSTASQLRSQRSSSNARRCQLLLLQGQQQPGAGADSARSTALSCCCCCCLLCCKAVPNAADEPHCCRWRSRHCPLHRSRQQQQAAAG
jgi:hypothetical protein